MQTIHVREPYKPERHRPSVPHVLLAQRHHLGKRRVVGALHVRKADRGLVHEQLERLGAALGLCSGSQDERADAHRLVELDMCRWAGRVSTRGRQRMAYVDV